MYRGGIMSKLFYVQLEIPAVIGVALTEAEIKDLGGKENFNLSADQLKLLQVIVKEQHADDLIASPSDRILAFQTTDEEVELCSKCSRMLNYFKKCPRCDKNPKS